MNAQQRQRSRSVGIHGARRSHPPQSPRAGAREATSRANRDYDSFWVRSALSQWEFLAAGRAIGADTKATIEFAIRWAPFGGASSEDLLVTFGVDRRRFLELVTEGLQSGRTDNSEERWLERRLADALLSAWRIDGGVASGTGHC